jgi:hypothetical protein
MPFNPTLPADGSLIIAAELRAQLTSLKGEIDALNSQVATLAAQLNTDTPHNPSAVLTLSEQGISFGDPEKQQLADKLNELIPALRR